MNKFAFIKDALILFLITLVAGVCLGAVYQITKQPIALAQEKATYKAYKQVFPEMESYTEDETEKALIEKTAQKISDEGYGKIISVLQAKNAAGEVIGHIVNSSEKGFGGDIEIAVGIKSDGTVNGIAFLSISESAGLGMNANKPDWYSQFSNDTGEIIEKYSVTKTGATDKTEINAISGATITSRAVTGAVNAAVYFVNNCLNQ